MIVLAIAVGIMHLTFLIKGYSDEHGLWFRRIYVRFLIRLLNIRIRKSGEIPTTNGLYVANHRMMIDPVIIVAFLNTFIVSKAEVKDYPLLGNGTRHTGVIFVERDNKDSRTAIREKIRDLLDAGKSVLLFPEGTVNTLPLTKTMHMGSFVEAAESGVPVMPIALDYRDTNVYWRENTSLLAHFIDVFRRWKLDCSIHFCSPVRDTDPERLMTLCKQSIDDALIHMRTEFDKYR